jgi:hypothetical protein
MGYACCVCDCALTKEPVVCLRQHWSISIRPVFVCAPRGVCVPS